MLTLLKQYSHLNKSLNFGVKSFIEEKSYFSNYKYFFEDRTKITLDNPIRLVREYLEKYSKYLTDIYIYIPENVDVTNYNWTKQKFEVNFKNVEANTY